MATKDALQEVKWLETKIRVQLIKIKNTSDRETMRTLFFEAYKNGNYFGKDIAIDVSQDNMYNKSLKV
jgi:hypothetical protein